MGYFKKKLKCEADNSIGENKVKSSLRSSQKVGYSFHEVDHISFVLNQCNEIKIMNYS